MHPDGPGWKVLAPGGPTGLPSFNHIEDVHPNCPLRKAAVHLYLDRSA
jgi:hypothetical protein